MINLHIDLDTPHTLNKIYDGPAKDSEPQEEYSVILLQRALDFFNGNGVKATFFLVTQMHRLRLHICFFVLQNAFFVVTGLHRHRRGRAGHLSGPG